MIIFITVNLYYHISMIYTIFASEIR